nr:immunoglobulin heavy chain junction region [Mus musculus]
CARGYGSSYGWFAYW